MIAPDPPASRKLYLATLGLPLEQLDEDYYASEHIASSKHFGVWPLSQAAQACYGTPTWPRDWGQTVARILSPEGLIVGLSFAPSLHAQSDPTT